MKLSQNFNGRFETTDIQFCVGIAVAHEGHPDIAQKIIEYKTYKTARSYTSSDDIREDYQIVNELREEVDAAIDRLAEEKNLSHDYAAVKWFLSTPIIKMEGGSIHGTLHMVSVESRIGVQKTPIIYADVMKMLLSTKHNKLITHYISTSMFDKPFRNALRMAIRKRNSQMVNTLSDSDYEILKSDFKKIYSGDLTDSSEPFRSITGNPNSALCGDPIKLWYVNNTKSKFQSVVFGSGQEIETQDGSVSLLNLREINDDSGADTIDFCGICTKIYAASKVLFGHKDMLIYDIFSRHCDLQLGKRIKDFNKQCKVMYDGISFEIAQHSSGECINETHWGKIKDRLKYADYLDERFSKSVKIHDLNNICNELYKITESVKVTDGHRLFTIDEHSIYRDTTESQRFEILFSGYRMMYELIDYINKNEKRTGVSVNDFPVTIFRDTAYHQRFNTFDSYIVGHDIVQKLVETIRTDDDDSRRAQKNNGFYNNETIHDILASKYSIKYIKEFAILGEKSVSYMYDVIHHKDRVSADVEIASDIVDIISFVDRDNFLSSRYPFIENRVLDDNVVSYDKMSYAECLAWIQLSARTNYELLKTIENEDSEPEFSRESYMSIITFLYMLERVQEMEGHPICDIDGFFRFSVDDMRAGIVETEKAYEQKKADTELPESKREEAEVLCTYLHSTALFRLVNLLMAYNVLFGEKLTTADSDILTPEVINTIYCSYSLIKKYIDSTYGILYMLRGIAYKDPENITKPVKQKNTFATNIFSLSLQLVDKLGMLSIPEHVSSDVDLLSLCTSDMPIYMDRGLISNEPGAIKRSEHRKEMTIIAFNRMLETFSPVRSFIENLGNHVEKKLISISNEMPNGDSRLLDRLEQLNLEILCDSYMDSDDCKLSSQIVQECADDFNEYDFMMCNGSLVYKDKEYIRTYYHKKGVACDIMVADYSVISHSAMTEDDRIFVQSI